MADRGRDLKFSILSDVSKFDTDGPARDLDQLGDEAQQTAKRVDDAFDKIARSSKTAATKVDQNMEKAEGGLKEFRDEAGSTGRESAASFSGGFDDVADAIQETAANAFAGLGPLGAAAGLAAAVGIGFVVSEISKAKERVAELTGSFLDLRKEGIDPATDAASHLVDELDAAQLSKFKRDADELGVSYEVLRAAFDGNAEAIAIVRREVARYNDENARGNPMTGEQADLMAGLTLKLNETETAYRNSGEAAKFLGDRQAEAVAATEAATRAVTDHAAALDGFTSPANTYTELLAAKEEKERATAEATAAATKSQKDSWEDYASAVSVSVSEYLAELERQVAAQETWATNLQTLAARGVDQGVLLELERLGPEGAPLIAQLTTASDAELAKMVALFGRQGAASGQAVASNLVGKAGAVSAAAAKVHAAAAVELARTITVPVKLEDATYAARVAWGEADAYFRRNPITLRTKGPTGQRPVRDVP